MRTLIAAALAISITGSAFAQTQRTYPSAYATIPTYRSSFATSSLNPCRSSINPTSPCYSGGPYPIYSAIPTELLSPPKPKAPSLGAGKLDEEKAKSLIKEKGYQEISELHKDPRGIWRGSARLKDGRQVEVVLDLEGNIYSEPKK
jgi:hypothetical protein